jgi:uncharacterized membrane protein YdjX (TVP38/TMEM64 family)
MPIYSSSSRETYPRISWTLIFQLIGLGIGAVAICFVATHYPLIDWVAAVQQKVEKLGVWSGIAYPFVCAICNLLLLPGGVLSMGGGFFFGLTWGFFLVLAGNLIGAATAILVGRKIGRHRVERLLLKYPKLRIVDRAIERHGWKIVVLTQLNPLAPSSLLNYIYGLTRVPMGRCLVWIALGQIPGLFLYALIGTLGQFSVEMAKGTRHPITHDYLLWGSGFLVTIVTTWLLGRLAKRIMDEVEKMPTEQSVLQESLTK